jgi:putative transcriptional regulator
MDFFSYKTKIAPAKGRLLISEPYLPDPNFERTVVLLCEHNEEGSFGFVLNRQSEASVADVVEQLAKVEGFAFIGGPVQQDTLHFLHRSPAIPDGTEVFENVFWGGDFEKLSFLVDTGQLPADQVRYFLGYSGWSPGQLEEELEANSWIVTDKVDEALIFETAPEDMWKRVLSGMGGRFSVMSNYPLDPRLN